MQGRPAKLYDLNAYKIIKTFFNVFRMLWAAFFHIGIKIGKNKILTL